MKVDFASIVTLCAATLAATLTIATPVPSLRTVVANKLIGPELHDIRSLLNVIPKMSRRVDNMQRLVDEMSGKVAEITALISKTTKDNLSAFKDVRINKNSSWR